MRSKIVGLVVAASLAAAVLTGAAWTWSAVQDTQDRFEEISPLVLQLAASGVRSALEYANAEVEWLALAGANGAALESALASVESFDEGLVIDAEGTILARVGSGAELDRLKEILEPRSAVEAELDDVMLGVQLRKELGSVQEGSVRLVRVPGLPPLPLASAPIRDAEGLPVAWLHAPLAPGALAAWLPASGSMRIRLSDAEGSVLASAGVAQHLGGGSLSNTLLLESLGWKLVVEQPRLLELQPVALTVAKVLAVSLVLALVFGGLAFRSGTRISRPLWALYEGLRELRMGNASELALRDAHGESESLVLAFNAMVQKLQEERSRLDRELRALREQNQSFRAQHETLSQLTLTDPLTQLANRRYFEDQLQREIKRLSRHGEGLSMLVIDVDDFKQWNDKYGHAAGDEFLRQVAKILKDAVRATDLVARYGGEEFVIVATSTTLEGATVLAEKVRTSVAETSFIVESTMRPRKATISVGVAEYDGSHEGLFAEADAALYRAKAAGKNCVIVADADDKASK